METGKIPGRFERREFCKDCCYILCGCGEAEYSASVHNYIKEHGWTMPEIKRTSRPP
jgi:hypothetical protein